MKATILLLCAAAAGGASAANFAPALPPVEFLDTEIATNIAISDVSQEARRYAFSLSFVGSASNNVEVAFGTDTDGNGALSDEEVEFSAGWDVENNLCPTQATSVRFLSRNGKSLIYYTPKDGMAKEGFIGEEGTMT